MQRAYGPPPGGRGGDPVRPPPHAAVERIVAARVDRSAVLLEGMHAVKHAVRFGADLEVVVTPDPAALRGLLERLAPDVWPRIRGATVAVDEAAWSHLAPRALPSPALGLAARPQLAAAGVLDAPGRVVVLEQPRHLGNLGAVVRVAAAAGAGGVLVVGDADPWNPTAVRSAAGLQFALAVARADRLPALDRPLVALDAGGGPLAPGCLTDDAVLAVGTERGGLSPGLRTRARRTVAIPMRAGVSSLNLATAVAVALYLGR